MQKLLRGRSWAAVLLLLLLGCRSERAAFSFRQPTLPASAAVAAGASPAAQPSLEAPLAPVSLPAPSPPVARKPAAAAPVAAARPRARQPSRTVAGLRQRWAVPAPRPETAARNAHRDTLHWVLGGALVVAGVVAGLLIGGWLGLGVGAALVLLGYYFVLLALGGRQAWLEVFQEFFNM